MWPESQLMHTALPMTAAVTGTQIEFASNKRCGTLPTTSSPIRAPPASLWGWHWFRLRVPYCAHKKRVLTVSTLPDGEFGIQNVCLSVPCIVSVSGLERILESSLPGHEQAALSASAAILERAINQLEEVV